MEDLPHISHQIWDLKYRLKGAGITTPDATIEDTWARVAGAVALAEKPELRARWRDEFVRALAGFKFLPAGRVLAGAGSGRSVTLFNCFVMGTIPDDMTGIFDNLKEAALTMQQGGGIGHDFSTLRPAGAEVRRVGADASGPVSFMDVWDAMCRTIMSAGSRRGAMMATLRCDHPDIESFIEAKRERDRLRNFNLSVLVTDKFMEAVKNDEPWDLVFDSKIYRTVSARGLWDRIMASTYAYAEPGVVFIDRINRRNNLWYAEHISATNPCVTADTWVMTAEGARQVRDLVGTPFVARVDGADWQTDERGFFPTGRKPVLRLNTDDGYALTLTANHRIRRVLRRTRHALDWEWATAGSLRPGDEILLNDHREAPRWGGAHSEDEGYLIGLLLGDGTLKSDKAVVSVWVAAPTADGFVPAGPRAVMAAAEAAARTLPHWSDFSGFVEVAGRNEHRLTTSAIKRLAEVLGLAPGGKAITPAMEQASARFTIGLLRGLFDTDGSVQGSQAKGVSVRLAQSRVDVLEGVQRMLLRLGIAGRIYRDRRPAGERLLPDGKGGRKLYACAGDHELSISGENLARFATLVGFADTDKKARLNAALGAYARTANRERFTARVAGIEAAGTCDVYDVSVPGVNAFDANGLIAHNCGEQPLPPYGACLLGSINLVKLIKKPFTDEAALDENELDALTRVAVRFLDDVIDVSNYPLAQQEREAKAKRRIGLGVTGLADALIMCRARYGGPESVALIERWLKTIQRAAYLASSEIAAEKGAFPLYQREKYLDGRTVRELDDDVRAQIAANGIRNALLTSVAPTGTISLLAENVSSGIEPVFAYSYKRKITQPRGEAREELVEDYAHKLYRETFAETALPDYFVNAQELTPHDHVAVQAAAQKYVDSSISKTVNCPADISFDAFKNVYLEAYESGCKGCTTWRPNEITGAILSVDETRKAAPKTGVAAVSEVFPAPRARPATGEGGVVYMTRPLDRPEALPGTTYKVRWPETDHAIYITINDVIEGGRRRPFEIFINSKNMEHYAWTVALTRMISAVFRRGGDVSFVVEELKAVFDPRGGQWVNRQYVPSLLAAIGGVIEEHMISIGFLTRPVTTLPSQQKVASIAERMPGALDEGGEAASNGGGATALGASFKFCPRCSSPSLTRIEGCDTCMNCGYSRCA